MNKREVEMGLCRIQEELKRSKLEMSDMKLDIEAKEEKWWEDRQRAEQEKLQLIKVCMYVCMSDYPCKL